jgi:hypothetical protein
MVADPFEESDMFSQEDVNEDTATDDPLEKFYTEQPKNNIMAGLRPAIESRPVPIEALNCLAHRDNKRLLLLPGHVGLAEYETTLSIAHQLARSILSVTNIPGAIDHLLQITAERHEIDYILIDMSPSFGALNQNFFTLSDYFIVPTAPDFFSIMGISSLAKVLPRWHSWGESAHQFTVEADAVYQFPKAKNRLLGYIVQRYKVRSGKPTRGFQTWFDKLQAGFDQILLPQLAKAGMYPDGKTVTRLAEISDFNSLIAKSQKHGVPVFCLTDEQLELTGYPQQASIEQRNEFNAIFTSLANELLTRIAKD